MEVLFDKSCCGGWWGQPYAEQSRKWYCNPIAFFFGNHFSFFLRGWAWGALSVWNCVINEWVTLWGAWKIKYTADHSSSTDHQLLQRKAWQLGKQKCAYTKLPRIFEIIRLFERKPNRFSNKFEIRLISNIRISNKFENRPFSNIRISNKFDNRLFSNIRISNKFENWLFLNIRISNKFENGLFSNSRISNYSNSNVYSNFLFEYVIRSKVYWSVKAWNVTWNDNDRWMDIQLPYQHVWCVDA